MEIYADINGYEGKYMVSTWGNVKNIQTGHVLIPEVTSKGYLRVNLVKDGIKKNHKIHRLVAETFLYNAEDSPQIDHIDGNKKNNSISNLRFCTNKENQMYKKSLLMMKNYYERGNNK